MTKSCNCLFRKVAISISRIDLDTPHFLKHLDMVTLRKYSFSKMNGKSNFGMNILLGHYDIVKFLIEKGSDVNVRDKGQTSAIEWAERNGNICNRSFSDIFVRFHRIKHFSAKYNTSKMININTITNYPFSSRQVSFF